MLLSRFTFHNVSINTLAHPTAQTSHISLHSTMFLLIRHHHTEIVHDLKNFTFHNVSINTTETSTRMEMWLDFTFHNVSINTLFAAAMTTMIVYFTFHNVSINTLKHFYISNMRCTLHSTMFLLIQNPSLANPKVKHLYIPQCFY